MRILAISGPFPTRHQSTPALHNCPQFAVLARHHDVRVIQPVSWTSMIHAVVGGSADRASAEWSDTSGVLHPIYCCPPRAWSHGHAIFFERTVRSAALRLMRDYQPEVILSSWAHPEGLVAVRFGKEIGLPVVLKVSGSPMSAGAGRRRGERVIQDLSGADGVIAVSRDLARSVVSLGVASHRVHVVPDGMSHEHFHPGDKVQARRRLGLPETGPIILFVGDPTAAEGATDLLKACAILRDRGLAVRCQFVGNKLDSSHVRRVIRSRGLEDRASFSGMRSDAELANWFRACDLVALPSYTEGALTVLRRAIACGTPFVATRVGGIPEIAHPSYSRLVVAGAIGDLADALAVMLECPPVVKPDLVSRVNGTWEASAGLLAGHMHAIIARASRLALRRQTRAGSTHSRVRTPSPERPPIDPVRWLGPEAPHSPPSAAKRRVHPGDHTTPQA